MFTLQTESHRTKRLQVHRDRLPSDFRLADSESRAAGQAVRLYCHRSRVRRSWTAAKEAPTQNRFPLQTEQYHNDHRNQPKLRYVACPKTPRLTRLDAKITANTSSPGHRNLPCDVPSSRRERGRDFGGSDKQTKQDSQQRKPEHRTKPGPNPPMRMSGIPNSESSVRLTANGIFQRARLCRSSMSKTATLSSVKIRGWAANSGPSCAGIKSMRCDPASGWNGCRWLRRLVT